MRKKTTLRSRNVRLVMKIYVLRRNRMQWPKIEIKMMKKIRRKCSFAYTVFKMSLTHWIILDFKPQTPMKYFVIFVSEMNWNIPEENTWGNVYYMENGIRCNGYCDGSVDFVKNRQRCIIFQNIFLKHSVEYHLYL